MEAMESDSAKLKSRYEEAWDKLDLSDCFSPVEQKRYHDTVFNFKAAGISLLTQSESSHPFIHELIIQIKQSGSAYQSARLEKVTFREETGELLQAMASLAEALPHSVLSNITFEVVDELLRKLYGILVTFSMKIERSSVYINILQKNIRTEGWPLSGNARYDAWGKDGPGLPFGRRGCTPGTRVGVIKRIMEWASNCSRESPQVFWVDGLAGTGKSTLAFTIANRLRQEKVPYATFFCSRQEDDTRRELFIVPTIVDQLSNISSSFSRALASISKSAASGYESQMEDMLVEPWKNSAPRRPCTLQSIVVVIDALDENKGGSRFLEMLVEAVNEAPQSRRSLRGLKFLVTSRPRPDIVKLCRRADTVCLHTLDRLEVQSDIRRYLNAELEVLQGHPLLEQIVDRADGLFIYAATAVRLARTGGSNVGLSADELKSRMRILLDKNKSAPGELSTDTLYYFIVQDALATLDKDLQQQRLEVLRAALTTEERVTCETLSGLLLIDKGTVEFTISSLYAVLYTMEDGTIHWYHASFPDSILEEHRFAYLFRGTRLRYRSPVLQQTFLAHHCFRIMESLVQFCSPEFYGSDVLFGSSNKFPSAVVYGIHYWIHHFHGSLFGTGGIIPLALINRFIVFSEHYLRHWIGLLSITDGALIELFDSARELLFENLGRTTKLLFTQTLDYLSQHNNSLSLLPNSLARLYVERFFVLATIHQKTGIGMFKIVDVISLPPERPLVQFQGHTGTVWSVSVPSYNAILASGSDDKTIRIWNAETGSELACLSDYADYVMSAAFSPDGNRIVSGLTGRIICVWNTCNYQQELRMRGHTDQVTAVAFSPDGTIVASGSADKTVRIWSASTGKCQRVLICHMGYVRVVAFSPLGDCIASGSCDRTVCIWKASTGELLMRLYVGNSVQAVSFSPDGNRLAVGASSSPVGIWNAQDGTKLMDISVNEGFQYQYAVTFSPDGALLVSSSNSGVIYIWDSTSGGLLRKLHGHSYPAMSVIFSPRGSCIYSGGFDSAIWAWDVSPNLHQHAASDAAKAPNTVLTNSTSNGWSIHAWHHASNTWWQADNKGWTRRQRWTKEQFDRTAEAADKSGKIYLFSKDRCIEVKFSEGCRPSEWMKSCWAKADANWMWQR